MFNPTDIIDKDLLYKTPIYNKMIEEYMKIWGKNCTYYINPNHEAKENDNSINNNDELYHQEDINDSLKRLDNYTLAYGKDMVGYDYTKMQQVEAKLLADIKSYYIHDVGAEDNVSFYINVIGTPVSRGDIISYNIQDKQIFYRITEKVQSYQEMIYLISCKLIQVKRLGTEVKTQDIIRHDADYSITPNNGIVL